MRLVARGWGRVRRITATAVGKVKLRMVGVECGEELVLYGVPIVTVAERSLIRIGRRVVLCSWSTHTALGVNHPVVLRTLAPEAELIIGDDVGISGGTICTAKRVVLGSESMLGANVTISDTDFHPLSSSNRRYNDKPTRVNAAEVVIGRNVFIGTNSIVLKGVRIGDNSVIGAGSVVTKDIPENVVAAGNPCRVLGAIDLPQSAISPLR